MGKSLAKNNLQLHYLGVIKIDSYFFKKYTNNKAYDKVKHMDIVLLIFVLLILLSIGWACLSLAPWVPTRKKDLPRICELAELKDREVFYDLGCGDGRLVFYTAKNFQAKSYGIELALPFYLYCQIKKWFSRNSNIHFKLKNLHNEDLSKADVVFLFAASSEKITDKLQNKLKSELKPGARIMSYTFPIPNWEAKKISKPTNNDLPIYLYRI